MEEGLGKTLETPTGHLGPERVCKWANSLGVLDHNHGDDYNGAFDDGGNDHHHKAVNTFSPSP
jgi:hypothetical protein